MLDLLSSSSTIKLLVKSLFLIKTKGRGILKFKTFLLRTVLVVKCINKFANEGQYMVIIGKS